MAKLQRNFIKGKMNKGLDERLVPNGEYIDALNVRVGTTELSEIGAVENSRGNERLTTLRYNSETLSTSAKCIGAFEDGANDTIYWFITDSAHAGGQATNKLDMIVSYHTVNNTVKYHVISVDDGGGTNTTLNFNSQYLITGVDKIDDLLFFTDNFNQPRFINVNSSYAYPATNIDGGSSAAAALLAESLLVIKKPPENSPSVSLDNLNTEQNFLEEKFICFAYRYRYADDQYSATSQFSDPAFAPKPFNYSSSSYLNEGMVNSFNTAVITFNTGSSLVIGIDLLFKESSNSVIRVIEKLDKQKLGHGDNQDYTYEFSNNKIYSILDDNEILRLYDNVPIKAKAQTIMDSRLVYGNYIDGFDIGDVKLLYNIEYRSSEIGLISLPTSLSQGTYGFSTFTPGPTQSILNSVCDLDLTDVVSLSGPGLKAGGLLSFEITFSHQSFSTAGVAPLSLAQTPQVTVSFSYVLQQDFSTVQALLSDQHFIDRIGTDLPLGTVKPASTSCTGLTFTDLLNCAIPFTKEDSNGHIYQKEGFGITTYIPSQAVLMGGSNNKISFQLVGSVYDRKQPAALPSSLAVEFYTISSFLATYNSIPDTSSLHSNRDYEVGMIYMDEYNRSTTVLVSPNNIVHIPCKNSVDKNLIRVTIPQQQTPPAWASRYKFAIKQNKDFYESIYSNLYFYDEESGCSYILLEGENAQKVSEGDLLNVKRDSTGPLVNCVQTTVLEKKAQLSDFIPNVTYPNGDPLYVPAGVYMKLKATNFAISTTQRTFIDTGVHKTSRQGQRTFDDFDFPVLALPVNFTGLVSNPQFFDSVLPEGSNVTINFSLERSDQPILASCPRRMYDFSQEYTVSRTYNSFKEWFEGDLIIRTFGNGTELLVQPAHTFIGPPTNPSEFMIYDSTFAANALDVGFNPWSNSIQTSFYNFFRFYQDAGGRVFLLIRSSIPRCSLVGSANTGSVVKGSIQILKGGNDVIFETEAQESAPDIFYESSVSYPITAGFHMGNVQNQSAVLPAIIDTEFQNCFAFGNGAESYKIRDSITRNVMFIGNRTSAVLEGEDFKEVHRFADLTYSGVYSFNVNNLNEFNLGLLNFKALEPSFGEIQKIFARATDILVLQEDKISYVLAGKNLLSDAAGGSVVTSVPEVLGTQIARLEEYGIGDNPESFASYGYDKYFTDSKRGVVIQLKGSSYSNDQLTVISNFGLGSWFRNLFIDFPNTQKLGAYDPYMKEYVLSSPNIALPFTPVMVDGGVKQRLFVTASQAVSYDVDLGSHVGNCNISYNVTNITAGAQFDMVVNYNSVNYPTVLNSISNQPPVPLFNKLAIDPQTATVTITYNPPGDPDPNAIIEVDVTLQKPAANTLNIFQICISDNNDSQETIHNEYRWSSGSFNSALHSSFVSLAEGTASPLVSQYNKITGPQGGNIVPIDGATVELISNRLQSDDFDFDSSLNNFAQLRTATLYNNTPTDIAALLAAASNVAASGSGGVFSGTFTMLSGNNNDNLYLIYDYRKPVAVTLCYSNTSADDACCTCGTSNTYYLNGPTLDKATAVYTSSALTTKAADGWYSTGGVYRKQISGVLEIPVLCSACNLACGTTLSMDTGRGHYTVDIDLGSGIGAVVVDVDFKTIPDGLKIEYNGVTYNSVYSPTFGFINSPGTNPLYTGITAFDCSVSGKTYILPKFQFNGTGFNQTVEVENVTVDPTSVFLKSSGLGTCKMIIPKTAASPSIATMTIISPCDKSEIEITPACPTALSAWESYQAAPSATNASGLCTVGAVTTYYHVVVGGSAGNPGVGDIIYTDANGTTLAGAGFYSVVGAAVIQVDANGVVASTPSCVP